MLNVNQRIELLERTLELVHYDIENERDTDINDIINDVTDNFVPAYYTDIAKEWADMESPEPEDYWLDTDAQMPIHQLMTIAIIETARNYLHETIPDLEADNEVHAETLRNELEYLGKARGYATLAKAIIE
jgi:hypothetical protein